MTTPTIDSAALTELAGRVSGPVLGSDRPELAAEVAGFNLANVHRPAVAVGAACPEDVVAALRWAADRGLSVSAQATGHGAVAALEGGLLVTTGRLRGVSVDPAARTARVAAGETWAPVVAAAAPHGLAPLRGSSSGVGAIGYTLGGGVPLMGRELGFAADHVRAIHVVTPDGMLRRVDADSDPELFWAMRGGSGNFGVVTALEVDLLPVGSLYGGGLYFPGELAGDALRAFRDWVPGLPERTGASLALLRLPPLPHVPPPLAGQLTVVVRMLHHGPAEEGERLLAPIRAVGPTLLDGVGPTSVAELDTLHADPADPLPAYERGCCLTGLPDDAVDTLLAQAGPGVDTPLVVVELRALGGAFARPAQPDNAVSGRAGAFTCWGLGPMFPGPAEVVPAACQGLTAAMSPWRAVGTPLNLVGSHPTPALTASAWDAATHERLCAVKRRVDPDGMIRCGHTLVPPAAHVPEQPQP